MTTLWQSESTIVDRVRITSRLSDPQAAQLRIANLLEAADLRPSRFPPSSILCVRKLLDPAPGAKWLDSRTVHLPAEWEESVTRELDRLAAQAVRPALMAVPPLAQAVLFLDRAELLSCLALDWMHGTLRANWWWCTLLRHGDPDAALFREWMRSPEFVPAALEALVARSRAVEFLRRLPNDIAASFLDNVLRVFGVPWSAHVRANQDHAVSENSIATPPLASDSVRIEIPPPSPWLSLIPQASAPDLPLIKQVLLVQALMLRRAPATARTIAFQKEMEEWQAWVTEHPRLRDAATATPPSGLSTQPKRVQTAEDEQPPKPELPGEVQVPADAKFSSLSPAELSAILSLDFDTREAAKLPAHPTEIDEDAQVELMQDKSQTSELHENEKAPAMPATDPFLGGVESAFGGVFFFLNVALSLELYADFTAPRGKSLELDIWDFICLLGMKFAGKEFSEDPLFELLATLAGRTKHDRPGAHFRPPEDWHLPREWLGPFPEPFERKEVVLDGRMQVAHPAGFVLVDEGSKVELGPVDALHRWLDWVSEYIRARLVRALGRDDASEFVCRIPARIASTPAHLDIFYSLDAYPVEIRLAGLDNDPGWIPAAGRYVSYHFD